MAKLLKLRRGTTSQHSSFTGAEGEVTVDTDKETLVVHNGSTAAGFALARADSPDNQKTRWGTGNDLEIFHNGSHSFIKDVGTGNLAICGSLVALHASDATENMILCSENGAVQLYYDNGQKFSTRSDGVKLDQGHFYADDSSRIKLGNGEDLTIYHDGSDSFIDENGTGDLKIRTVNGNGIQLISSSSENMITCATDGAVDLYYDNSKKFETKSTGVKLSQGHFYADDNSQIKLGDAEDFNLWHDGTTSIIFANNNNLSLRPKSGENGILVRPDGNVELYHNDVKKLETTSSGATVTGNIVASSKFRGNDSVKVSLGDGEDLQLYHDGSHSFIKDAGSGTLQILTDSLRINNPAASENIITGDENGAVGLYYDNSVKLETQSTGVKLTGNAHGLELKTTSANSGSFIRFSDHNASDDGRIQYEHSTDEMLFLTGSSAWRARIGNTYFKPESNNSFDLGTDSQRFRDIYVANDIDIKDSGVIKLGDSDDLKLYHSGSHSFIDDSGTGSLYVTTSGFIVREAGTNDNMFKATGSSACNLYYDNSNKLETTSTGVQVTGNIDLDGNIDGADGSKIKLGTGDDLEIYHDGTNSFITNSTGYTLINNTAANDSILRAARDVYLQPDGGDNAVVAKQNGEVKLYHNGNLKMDTVTDGIQVYGIEGGQATIHMHADEGDEHEDKWQFAALPNGEFHLKHKAGNAWKTAWYCFSEDHLSHPVLRGPAGGIRFDENMASMNADKWNDYAGDGMIHRTDGQAYLTCDDYFRIRQNGNSENKKFEFRPDTGNAGAQNDWQDDQFDFAEMFEWSDGNPDNEDRIGNTVAVDGLTGKIKIAESGDTVIGVVSGTAAFTANCAGLNWHGAYLRDEWGRLELELVKDADGNQLYNDPDNGNVRPKVSLKPNPDWDKSKSYHRREDRKEWDKIGIIGQCYVRKTAVIPSSWIKLKEIDSTKDFYLIK